MKTITFIVKLAIVIALAIVAFMPVQAQAQADQNITTSNIDSLMEAQAKHIADLKALKLKYEYEIMQLEIAQLKIRQEAVQNAYTPLGAKDRKAGIAGAFLLSFGAAGMGIGGWRMAEAWNKASWHVGVSTFCTSAACVFTGTMCLIGQAIKTAKIRHNRLKGGVDDSNKHHYSAQ